MLFLYWIAICSAFPFAIYLERETEKDGWKMARLFLIVNILLLVLYVVILFYMHTDCLVLGWILLLLCNANWDVCFKVIQDFYMLQRPKYNNSDPNAVEFFGECMNSRKNGRTPLANEIYVSSKMIGHIYCTQVYACFNTVLQPCY